MFALFAVTVLSIAIFQIVCPRVRRALIPDWGVDNRAAGIRLPGVNGPGARLAHRIAGADVNPYLVLSAIIGGMLNGLKNDLPLPPALDDDNAEQAEPQMK